jgi:hypothetical protein
MQNVNKNLRSCEKKFAQATSMPRKCSVFGCRTNYSNAERGTVYAFPSDEAERNRWIAQLPNRDFIWTPSVGICSKHWPSNFPTRKAHNGIPLPAEPPTVFPNVPPSCIPKRRSRKVIAGKAIGESGSSDVLAPAEKRRTSDNDDDAVSESYSYDEIEDIGVSEQHSFMQCVACFTFESNSGTRRWFICVACGKSVCSECSGAVGSDTYLCIQCQLGSAVASFVCI